MKNTILKTLCLGVVTLTLSLGSNTNTDDVTPAEARSITKEAYIYSYAMIEGYKTLYQQVVDSSFPGYIGGFNRYRHYSRVATPADKDIVSPNNDTPYSWAWLDLRREPIVLQVPAVEKDRYNVFQWFDLYTHNFAYAGVRTTGYKAGNYLFAGPNWKGVVPEGITKVFHSETDIIGTLTRTSVDGEDDIPKLQAIQKQYTFKPLSEFASQKPPVPVQDIEFPVWDDKKARSAEFIEYFNFLLQFCQPLSPSEKEMMQRFAKIGIGSGQTFNPTKLNKQVLAAIEEGAKDGLTSLQKYAEQQTTSGHLFGSRESLGKDYLINRSAGALLGIYANSIEEAYYTAWQVDSAGKPLTGKTDRFVLKFPAGELPPVNLFWSLTMYSVPDRFLVDNPINRYSIGDRSEGLKINADGSLTIYIQKDSPGADKESNWLPAPDGPFFIAGRMYEPKEPILKGKWEVPAIEKLK